MGGHIGKDKLVSKDGSPKNILKLHNFEWIYGGSFPGYKSTFDYLQKKGIKLIITLTIEPIRVGRNINHIPHTHIDTEWINSDLEEEDLERFDIIHIPIADGSYPTASNASRLLNIVTEYRKTNPKDKIYFHCWLGKDRTCMIIIYILMKLYNMTYDNAYMRVKQDYKIIKLTPEQHKFLNNLSFSSKEIINSQPIVKTPKNHECYDNITHIYEKEFNTDNDSGSFMDDKIIPVDDMSSDMSSTEYELETLKQRAIDIYSESISCIKHQVQLSNTGKRNILQSLNDLYTKYCHGEAIYIELELAVERCAARMTIYAMIDMQSPNYESITIYFVSIHDKMALEVFNLSNPDDLYKFLYILKSRIYVHEKNKIRKYIVGFDIWNYDIGHTLIYARLYGYEEAYREVYPEEYFKDVEHLYKIRQGPDTSSV